MTQVVCTETEFLHLKKFLHRFYFSGFFVVECHLSVFIYTRIRECKDSSSRITFTARINGIFSYGFFQHLILVVGKVESRSPHKRLGMDIACRQSYFDTFICHAGPVDVCRRKARFQRKHLHAYQVHSFAVIIVHTQVDSLIQYSKIQSDINRMSLFPAQLVVWCRGYHNHVFRISW